jgi:hypothetical protein
MWMCTPGTHTRRQLQWRWPLCQWQWRRRDQPTCVVCFSSVEATFAVGEVACDIGAAEAAPAKASVRTAATAGSNE